MRPLLTRVLLASFASIAFAQPTAKYPDFYSVSREVQLGRQAAEALERTLPIVHEPTLDAYLSQLGSDLANHADPQFTYTFAWYDDRSPVTALPDPMVLPSDAFSAKPEEPVAIAGGHVLVPLRLLAAAPSESVFAFELAHAIAHIALRHATRQVTMLELAPIGNRPLNAQEQRLQAASLATMYERDADSLAARIMAEAGYDPQTAIQHLEDQSPGSQSASATDGFASAKAAAARIP
jgi:predicted Zn-dependent protease